MLKPEEVQMQNMSLYAGNPQQAMYAAHHGNHMVRLFNRISNFLKLLGFLELCLVDRLFGLLIGRQLSLLT
jgi:hypothetical protein